MTCLDLLGDLGREALIHERFPSFEDVVARENLGCWYPYKVLTRPSPLSLNRFLTSTNTTVLKQLLMNFNLGPLLTMLADVVS